MTETPSETISVAIIDDHTIIHDGVRSMAEREPDIRFVGGATNPTDGYALIERTNPDVIILDVRLGKFDGIELCAELRKRFPGSPVLIFSGFCTAELLAEVIRAGASGYMLKDTDTTRMPWALREFHRTGRYFDSQVTSDLLIDFVDHGGATSALLSEREQRIVELIAAGASNHDIALELHISYHTVKAHVAALLRRFDVSRRAELVKVAMERQIVRGGQ